MSQSSDTFHVTVLGTKEEAEAFARELKYISTVRAVHVNTHQREPEFFDDQTLGHGEVITAVITIATTVAAGLTEDALRAAFKKFSERGRRLHLKQVEPGRGPEPPTEGAIDPSSTESG